MIDSMIEVPSKGLENSIFGRCILFRISRFDEPAGQVIEGSDRAEGREIRGWGYYRGARCYW